MTFTGIKATPEETEKLLKMAQDAANTPVIYMGGPPSLADSAWDSTLRACHKCALEHGLPEFQGYYGITENGEFVRP